MHPRIIRAIARKDALDLLLNKQTLFMLLSPILVALLFLGLTILLGNSNTTQILVYNPDHATGKVGVEQVLTGAFSDAKLTYASSADDVAAVFGPDGTKKNSTYALGLVVPANFEASIQAGQHPELKLYTNGDDINSQQHDSLVGLLTNYSRAVVSLDPVTVTTATINPPKPNTTVGNVLTTFYAMAALVSSFLIGTAVAPGLLIEEKEKKTLRMLMVSPAAWADVIAAKLLVAFGYQVLLALVALAITKGYTGQVPLVLLFALLGSFFSVAVGALAGSIFKTQGASGAFSGVGSFLYIVPIFFVGPFSALIGGSGGVAQLVKVLPTYWLADGVINAMTNQSALGTVLLDAGVAVGATLLLFLVAVWGLRRQASVVGTI
jgi:ABC-2 type transport system permease protein